MAHIRKFIYRLSEWAFGRQCGNPSNFTWLKALVKIPLSFWSSRILTELGTGVPQSSSGVRQYHFHSILFLGNRTQKTLLSCDILVHEWAMVLLSLGSLLPHMPLLLFLLFWDNIKFQLGDGTGRLVLPLITFITHL